MGSDTSGVKYVETVAWVIIGLLGAGLLVLLPVFDDRRIWGVAFDAGHAPMFGFFAVVMLRLSHLWIGERIKPIHHYLIAAMVTAFGGVLTEAAQVVMPRDASVLDLVRDVIGIAAGLSLHWAIYGKKWPAVRWGAAIVAVAMACATWVPLAKTLSAYRDRAKAFPQLIVFEPGPAHRFVEVVGAKVEYADGRATVTYAPGEVDYPRLEAVEVERDWRGYDQLAFRVTNESDGEVLLNVRIHDAEHHGSYSDRYNGEFPLSPGQHDIAIPLREIQDAPAKRSMDLRDMRNINFFLVKPDRPIRLVFENVRLEDKP